MNLYIFATVHILINNTKPDWQLPSSDAREIRFEHRTHSPYVLLVLWFTVSHTRVAPAKQDYCLLHLLSVFKLAVPLFHLKLQLNRKYDYILNKNLFQLLFLYFRYV